MFSALVEVQHFQRVEICIGISVSFLYIFYAFRYHLKFIKLKGNSQSETRYVLVSSPPLLFRDSSVVFAVKIGQKRKRRMGFLICL